MAVTVIGPPKRARSIECSHCGYELSHLPSDVRHYHHDMDLGDTAEDEYDYIVCPQCRKRVVIEKPREFDDI